MSPPSLPGAIQLDTNGNTGQMMMKASVIYGADGEAKAVTLNSGPFTVGFPGAFAPFIRTGDMVVCAISVVRTVVSGQEAPGNPLIKPAGGVN